MWFNIGPFLFIFFTSFTSIHSVDDEMADSFHYAADDLQLTHGEIIFSVMVFRHGDRYAISDYPNNLHSQYMIDAGVGQLTRDGKNRAFRLGLWTRKRYDFLMNDRPYSSDLIDMISTTSERAVSSGQLFLAGFYQPKNDDLERWHPDIRWQPIPVYTNDEAFGSKHYCPHFNLEADRVKNYPDMISFHEKHREMYSTIAKNRQREIPLDDPIQAVQKCSAFYDTMYVQELLELEHPSWLTKDIYPQGKQEVQAMFFKLQTYTEKMKRFKGGPLLSNIIKELKKKRDKPELEKIIQFFSCHDTNIVGLLNSLGVWDGKLLPSYCASLLFELRKFQDDYIVTILYRDTEDTPLQLLELKKCSNPCSLDNFIEVTKSVISENLEEECSYLTPDYNSILF